MSENTTKPTKNYPNGVWIREKTFNNGGSILNVNILKEKFLESLNNLKADDAGFVRLNISKRLNPDNKSSHSLYVDDWKPTGQKAAAPSVKTEKTSSKPKTVAVVEDGEDMF